MNNSDRSAELSTTEGIAEPLTDQGVAGLPVLGLGFELSVLPMMLVDDAWLIVAANTAAGSLLAADPLVGRSLLDFAAPAAVDVLDREGRRLRDGGSAAFEVQMELPAGSGQARPVELRLDAAASGPAPRYLLVQLHDITAQRRQENELTVGDQRYRHLVDHLPDSAVLMFDRDLRLTKAAGEAFAANGQDPNAMTGRMLEELVPRRAWPLLGTHYRETLDGRSSDFDYDSPSGRQFWIRTRPISDADGSVIGGLVLSQDVTGRRARQSELEQAHQLARLGSCRYDRRSGWSYDQELLALWGIDSAPDFAGFPLELLPADDRAATASSWAGMITSRGRHTLSYQIRHGRSGEIRHLQCSHETVIDSDGTLLRVVATHVDVTEAIVASERAESERAMAAQERLSLIRQVGDTLATSRLEPAELLTGTTNLAAAAIGEGAVLRIADSEFDAVERDQVAHPDESVRSRTQATLQLLVDPTFGAAIRADVVLRGNLVSTLRPEHWRPEILRQFRERVVPGTEHLMIAPVRHNGAVLGVLAVFRTAADAPYRLGDDDVLQLLADGIGAAVGQDRTRQRAERERDERLAAFARHQHDQLSLLAGMETRERFALAESIENEPIQSIAAGIIRLDQLRAELNTVTRDDRARIAARDQLDRVVQQLESTADWLRNLVAVALIPPDLAGGLGPALATLARGIFLGTPTAFAINGPHHVGLGVPAKEAAYRIFREALVNVRKHARATTVTLQLDQREDVVVLSLTDDGIGSATLDAGPGQFGIATMRARASAEGGQLHVESIEGLGTAVMLTLPRSGRPDAADQRGQAAGRTRTVLVCENQKYLRDDLSRMLGEVARFDVVGGAFDRASCLERIEELRPDVLIMAYGMHDGGPMLVQAAKELHPDMHVVVFGERSDIRGMMRAGADQYIVKSGKLRPVVRELDRAFDLRLSG